MKCPIRLDLVTCGHLGDSIYYHYTYIFHVLLYPCAVLEYPRCPIGQAQPTTEMHQMETRHNYYISSHE